MLGPPVQGGAGASAADVPAVPMERNYEDDVSRVFISLNNGDKQPAGGEAEKKQHAEAKEGGASASYQQEEQRAGALAEYFSSLFDESFCSHNFKLVG